VRTQELQEENSSGGRHFGTETVPQTIAMDADDTPLPPSDAPAAISSRVHAVHAYAGLDWALGDTDAIMSENTVEVERLLENLYWALCGPKCELKLTGPFTRQGQRNRFNTWRWGRWQKDSYHSNTAMMATTLSTRASASAPADIIMDGDNAPTAFISRMDFDAVSAGSNGLQGTDTGISFYAKHISERYRDQPFSSLLCCNMPTQSIPNAVVIAGQLEKDFGQQLLLSGTSLDDNVASLPCALGVVAAESAVWTSNDVTDIPVATKYRALMWHDNCRQSVADFRVQESSIVRKTENIKSCDPSSSHLHILDLDGVLGEPKLEDSASANEMTVPSVVAFDTLIPAKPRPRGRPRKNSAVPLSAADNDNVDSNENARNGHMPSGNVRKASALVKEKSSSGRKRKTSATSVQTSEVCSNTGKDGIEPYGDSDDSADNEDSNREQEDEEAAELRRVGNARLRTKPPVLHTSQSLVDVIHLHQSVWLAPPDTLLMAAAGISGGPTHMMASMLSDCSPPEVSANRLPSALASRQSHVGDLLPYQRSIRTDFAIQSIAIPVPNKKTRDPSRRREALMSVAVAVSKHVFEPLMLMYPLARHRTLLFSQNCITSSEPTINDGFGRTTPEHRPCSLTTAEHHDDNHSPFVSIVRKSTRTFPETNGLRAASSPTILLGANHAPASVEHAHKEDIVMSRIYKFQVIQDARRFFDKYSTGLTSTEVADDLSWFASYVPLGTLVNVESVNGHWTIAIVCGDSRDAGVLRRFVRVHYCGWDTAVDDWISVLGGKISPLGMRPMSSLSATGVDPSYGALSKSSN
jgi:hypothetical protein